MLALLTLMSLVAARPVSAQDSYALSAVLASGPYYPTNRWLPVRVVTINRTDRPVAGHVEFPLNGADERVMFRLPITVPAKSSITAVAYVYIPVMPEATEPARGKNKTLTLVEKPPLCTVVWRDKAGAMISRCPVLAQPVVDDNDGPLDRVRLDRPLILAINAQRDSVNQQLPEGVNEPTTFVQLFQSTQGLRLLSQFCDVAESPRDRIGFDGVGVALLDSVAIDRMDVAQQEALIQYMTVGGTVVICVGAEMIDPSQSWLAPYLPARYVGSRFASSINVSAGEKTESLPLAMPLDIAEWVADPNIPGARVVAADKHYVHLAYQTVGLGRLIVTSFPPTSLDITKPAVRQLWASAFPDSPAMNWDTSKLSQMQSGLLESMVGMKVPPWIVAASVVGAYVLVVLTIQLVARQGRRPVGFAIAVGVAILIAVGLVIASSLRDRTVVPSMARIDLLDLSVGGMRTEAVSLLGPDQTGFPISVGPGVGLRQASASDAKQLDLSVSPLRITNAAVYPQRVDRVWQLSSAVPAEMSLQVNGRFDERGLSLSVDNQVGVIEKPVIIGPHGQIALADIPSGKSELRADAAEAHSSAVKLEGEQLRDRILDAAMSKLSAARLTDIKHRDSPIYLAGWMANAPAPLIQLPDEQQPAIARTNALARTGVKIIPSPVGSAVHVSSAFTQFASAGLMGMPYDPLRQQWMDVFTPSEFLVGFSVPQSIGHFRAKRVAISMQAEAPLQTITLYRGQAIGGKVRLNSAGPEIAQWKQLMGSRSVALDVADGDIDANGWMWIRVNIECPPGQSRWKIQDFSIDYDGVIDGPPRPVVLPVREYDEMPDAKQIAPNPAPAKKPAKKPATKPATKPTGPKKKASQP